VFHANSVDFRENISKETCFMRRKVAHLLSKSLVHSGVHKSPLNALTVMFSLPLGRVPLIRFDGLRDGRGTNSRI
jgi:hypothetical protein